MPPRRRRAQRATLPLGGSVGFGPGRLVGTNIDGRFRLDRLLGAGGLGEVYEAHDLIEQTTVAIKVLLPALRGYPLAMRRFQREGHAGRLLDHPNIVGVTSMGTLEDGSLYLVMELIIGDDLAALIEDGPMAPRRALAITRQVLDGLEHAHGCGVVHRDLKPANIMVAHDGRHEVVKILDFGLAKLVGDATHDVPLEKLTETGAVFGTPTYMAPEQALGRPAKPQTDLYSMGIILYEMLTGRPPFRGADPQATMRLHIKAEVPPLPQSVELDAVLRRALQKPTAARFLDAAEMRAALDAAVGALPESV